MAGVYQVFNGSVWVDICDCMLSVVTHDGTWKEVDPYNCPVRYWTGEEWCTVECNPFCFYFLESRTCSNFPELIEVHPSVCMDIFPTSGCESTVTYIPISLGSQDTGFKLSFGRNSIYSGLDVVDVCNQNVLGGFGMVGTSSLLSGQVIPGTYSYTRKLFYNFTLSEVEELHNYPDIDMTFSYPSNCINDWGYLTGEEGETTGYENLVSQGDTMPSSLNEMYLPRLFEVGGADTCSDALLKWGPIKFVFNRPAPPLEGYPVEETFLIRVFGHPTNGKSQFQIADVTCL